MDKLEALLERAKATLSEEDYQDFKLLADSYVCLTGLVEDKNMSIRRLRKLLFGPTTEKTSDVTGSSSKDDTSGKNNRSPKSPRPSPKGHGRNGAKAYTGAKAVSVNTKTTKKRENASANGRVSKYLPNE